MRPFTTPRTWSQRWLPLLALAFLAAWFALDGGLFPSAFPLFVLALVVLLTLGGLVSGLMSRLSVDATGALTVRGLLPGGRRTVDLSQLSRARAQREVRVSGSGDHRRTRMHDVLELEDAAGRRVRLEPRLWRRADLLIEAVEAAAEARDVPIEGGELFAMRRTEPDVPLGEARGLPELGPAPEVPLHRLEFRPHGPSVAGAVFAGVGLGVIGLSFMIVGGFVGSLLARDQAAPVALVFPLAGLLMTVLAVLLLSAALMSRIVLTPDGLITVRSFPPWGRRSVRLDELAGAEAQPGPFVTAPGVSGIMTRVVLIERSGRRASFTGDWWQDPGILMPALAAWAASAGADMDERTRAYLLHGHKPVPAGPRPTGPA